MKYNIFPSFLKNVNSVVLRNQLWLEGRYWTSSKILLVTFLCDTVFVVEIKVTCQNWNNYRNDGNCKLLVRRRLQCSRPQANIFSATVSSATLPYYAINNRWIAFTVRWWSIVCVAPKHQFNLFVPHKSWRDSYAF